MAAYFHIAEPLRIKQFKEQRAKDTPTTEVLGVLNGLIATQTTLPFVEPFAQRQKRSGTMTPINHQQQGASPIRRR